MSPNNNLIEIAQRPIGPGYPTYVIAELSANHNQDIGKAIELIHKAKECGADAVKIQTYTPDTITIDVDSDLFRHEKDSLWAGRTLYELYGEAYTPWEWHHELKEVAGELDIALFSSPFDGTAVDFLEEMNVPAFKIASFELVDLPLIRRVAHTGKPMIMSTGMATLPEIEEAVKTAREAGATQIALLKCTSAYPALPEEANLRTIQDLTDKFGVQAGLSDHTLGIAVPVAAVALGATIVEKHFTISRSIPGPDSAFSLEPQEFKAMVDAIRVAEQAVGKVSYELTKREEASRVFRRSLFVVKDIKAGEVFTEEHIRSIRPGYGLHTRYFTEVIGRRASEDLTRGTPLSLSHVAQ